MTTTALKLNLDSTPYYEFDKKTGEVTMPSGKKFNPILNQNCDELSLEELRIYNLERGLTDDNRRLPEHHSPEYVWGTPEDHSVVDAELEVLAEKALKSAQKLKAAELQSKSDSDALKKALEKAGRLTEDNRNVGPVRTVIYPTRRFDETLARSLMTAKLQKECSKVVLDTKLVQAKVSPETYASFQKTSGWTLKLDVAD